MSGTKYSLQAIIIDDEGTRVGVVPEIDFAGAGVTAALSGNKVIVTIPGGGGPGTVNIPLGVQNIFVSKSGVDATGTNADISKNYLTITAAIAKAATLTPSATNVINIITYPGTYVESFTIPSYVNLISVLPPRFIYNEYGFPTDLVAAGGALGSVYVQGTITKTGTNSTITGVNCDNLILPITVTGNNYFNNMVVTTAISGSAVGSIITCYFYDVHCPLFLPEVTLLFCSFNFCTAIDDSFASSILSNGGNITACNFQNIVVNDNCFSSSRAALTTGGSIGGTYSIFDNIICRDFCFASSVSGNGGLIDVNAWFKNIRSRSYNFVSSQTATGGSCASTVFINIKSTSILFSLAQTCVFSGVAINITSTMQGCVITGTLKDSSITNVNGFSTIYLGSGGKAIFCEFQKPLDGVSETVGALGALTADIRHCDLKGGGFSANITLATATPYNTNDTNSL